MKLIELQPEFLKIKDKRSYFKTDNIKEADGIFFLCPVCFLKNNGAKGTHYAICWQPHVSLDFKPTPGRWEFLGTGFNDLTLVNGSSSVLFQDGCGAHFFIKNGEIEIIN